MYHIKKDMRSQKSAQALYQGLVECMKRNAFDQISVFELQRAAGVSRSTFYRCFDNLSDILYWKCDCCFRDALVHTPIKEIKQEDIFLRNYFSYWMTHSEILELLQKIKRIDIIFDCHRKNAEAMAEKYGKPVSVPRSHEKYMLAIRTGLTITILTTWIQTGKQESVDEIMEILNEQKAFVPVEAAAE